MNVSNPSYESDLAKMKSDVENEKLFCFEHLKLISRMNHEELNACGYPNLSNAEAMLMSFNRALKKIDKITNQFVAKYPD